jgi:hypothetical protein
VSTRDPRVDDYLAPLPAWQRETLEQVREVLHQVDPELTETIKRTVQPYFVCHGNVAAFLAARDHVNVFVYDGGIVPDPDGLVTAGQENKTARTIAFREGDDVPREALLAFFGRLVADNRAGGWRKLKATSRATSTRDARSEREVEKGRSEPNVERD